MGWDARLIGRRFIGGRFLLEELVGHGMFRARDTLDGAGCLVTVAGAPRTPRSLERALQLPFPGVAALRFAGPVDVNGMGEHVVVEAASAGRPGTAPLLVGAARRVIRYLACTVRAAPPAPSGLGDILPRGWAVDEDARLSLDALIEALSVAAGVEAGCPAGPSAGGGDAAAPSAFLEVLAGPVPVQASGSPPAFEVPPEGVLVLGRKAGRAHVVFDSLGVAGRHASIRRTDEVCEICDVGSPSGTWVNDRKASGPVRLEPGDRITMAHVVLVFHTSRPGAP